MVNYEFKFQIQRVVQYAFSQQKVIKLRERDQPTKKVNICTFAQHEVQNCCILNNKRCSYIVPTSVYTHIGLLVKTNVFLDLEKSFQLCILFIELSISVLVTAVRSWPHYTQTEPFYGHTVYSVHIVYINCRHISEHQFI